VQRTYVLKFYHSIESIHKLLRSDEVLSAGSTAASTLAPRSLVPPPRRESLISRAELVQGGGEEVDCVEDAADCVPPLEPAIVMSPAPPLNQELPELKQNSSIIEKLDRELRNLPAVPGEFPTFFFFTPLNTKYLSHRALLLSTVSLHVDLPLQWKDSSAAGGLRDMPKHITSVELA
jgi:hypothetical protein